MDNLKNMNGFELLQALSVLARQDEYLEEFNQVYAQILEQAKITHDFYVLKKAQDLRWKQTEYLVQQWIRTAPPVQNTGWSPVQSWGTVQ